MSQLINAVKLLNKMDNVILEKIDNIKSDTFEIKEHLKTLNSKVADNTRFRIEGKTYFKIIGVTLVALIVPLVLMVFDKVF